jgi:signal transduction histidine kinase
MERLRFSTAILRLLGEELSPSPDQGILELIKNAYDADATRCTVQLTSVHLRGGSIQVWDDGIGMSKEDIRNGWLVVGDSLKSRTAKSPSGRLLVGSKGLGRLGALRLGQIVTLVTRPVKEPGVQYRVEIDWKKFDLTKVVEEVDLDIVEEGAPIGTGHGTEITIADLPEIWRKADIQRLARAILLLRDPFSEDTTFRATLKADDFEEIERLALSSYFPECDFHLQAELDSEGHANACVKAASGKVLFEGMHNEISGEKGHSIYRTPEGTFELWEFLLSGKNFSSKQVTLAAVKEWIEQFGGVRLYHRGVRVLPYGEPKNDWLDMNLLRVRNPELRPSTNNSLGCVRVTDRSGILQQKTDRLGFVESEAFDELRRFTQDVLDWMYKKRLHERETHRKTQKEQSRVKIQKADAKVKTVLEKLPEPERKEVAAAIEELRSAHQTEVGLKDETAQLYFTLGTVGTTAAAFAHQTKVPIKGIVSDANILEEYLGDPETLALFREESSQAVKRIHREAKAIYSFSSVTLKLLEHEKRRSGSHPVHQLIDETVELLRPYLDARETIIDCDYTSGEPKIWCTKAAFEAILTNLLTNSLQAFELSSKTGKPLDSRRIFIQTRISGETIIIRVLDNGPGIDELSVNDIWIAGKTTTERGTGLGLAIVKDVVEDLRGRVEAEAHGELGGAAFTITLPLKN